MDYNSNKNSYNDEIDLVDVLGVLIKRRKFLIISFIFLFLFSSGLMFYKERSFVKNENLKLQELTVCVRCGYDYVISIDNDVLSYMYNILNIDYAKSINAPSFVFEVDYNNFVKNFIFIDTQSKLDFMVSNIETKTYLFFKDEVLKDTFVKNYKSFNETLSKSLINKNFLKDLSDYECIDRLLNKDLAFKASKACLNYYNSYLYLMNKFSLAVRRNFTPSAFIFNSIIENIDLYKINIEDKDLVFDKIRESKQIEYEEKAIKFDNSKFIKYLVIVFILSFIISIFLVYIWEFYLTNKDRLRGYFK